MPIFSSESFPALVKVGTMVMFLTGLAFFAFAGFRERMPVREPVLLDPREIYICPRGDDSPAPIHPRGEETVHGDRPLRVVSYNIHECRGLDLQTDPERVAAVIRALDADVVSLQEVLISEDGHPSCQLRYLAEKTGMRMAVAGPTMKKKGVHYGNALMSRYPITNVRLHDISLGTFEPRGIIEADILVGNRPVRVIATHFGLWPTERNRQAQRLLEILPENAAYPMIVMGDMNGWVPGSPVMRRLKKRLGRPATARSFPSTFPLLPLDRVWVLPGFHRFEVEAINIPLARVASDHLPVLVSVSLNESNVSSR